MKEKNQFKVYDKEHGKWVENPALVKLSDSWGATGQIYVNRETNDIITEATWEEFKEDISDGFKYIGYVNHKACNYVLLDFSDALMIADQYRIVQYTGTRDKNDQKIYEGDIVEGNFATPWDHREKILLKGIIEWQYNAFWLSVFEEDSYSGFLGMIGAGLKVVGNKFDDPELIPGDEQ